MTDANVLALWKFLVGESREVSKGLRHQPWTSAKNDNNKGQYNIEKYDKGGQKGQGKGKSHKGAGKGEDAKYNRLCYICESPDHIAPNCPNKAKGQPVVGQKGDGKKAVTCFDCGGPHYRRYCPKAKVEDKPYSKIQKPNNGKNVTPKHVSCEDEQDDEEYFSDEEVPEESPTDLKAVRVAMEVVKSLMKPEEGEASLNTLVATIDDKKNGEELILLDGGATHDVYVCPRQDAIKGIPKKVHLAHGTRDAFVDMEEGRVTFLDKETTDKESTTPQILSLGKVD